LPLPEIEPRFLGGSDRHCTDRAIPAPVVWLDKTFLSSFFSSELAQAAMLLTIVWKSPFRISAGTPTLLIESFRGFTEPLPENNESFPENGSRPLPHALKFIIISTP
jgi:hypothetical protein